MRLTNLDNGYTISDSFEVRESIPFEIERIGPTRIYPPNTYEITLKIKVNKSFSGEIKESVPSSFDISNQEQCTDRNLPFIIRQKSNNEKELVWQNITLKKGEITEIKYQFDAPDISPYFYLLGPLEFYQLPTFSETRQWQIAVDSPADYTQACQSSGVANCRNGSECSRLLDCYYSTCGYSCPAPSVANSSYAGTNTCSAGTSYNCDCDGTCSGTASCTISGTCDYDCDAGYTWNGSTCVGINISGNVYEDEGTTALVACDGTTNMISLYYDGTTYGPVSCGDADGSFTFSDVPQPSAGTDGGPITNSDMDTYDNDDDTDINYVVDASNNLTVEAGSKLIINSNDTFTPGGTVTLAGVGSDPSGDLLVMSSATLDGTYDVTVNGGDVTGDGTINLTGGTFTVNNSGNFGGATAWTFNNLTFGDGTGSTSSWTQSCTGNCGTAPCIDAGETCPVPVDCRPQALSCSGSSSCPSAPANSQNTGGTCSCSKGDESSCGQCIDSIIQGAKILMSDGTYKNIEDIQKGEYVKSFNPETGEFRNSKVYVTSYQKEKGYLIINNALKLTKYHVIYLNHEFQEAGNAKIGDYLLNEQGQEVEIFSIEYFNNQEIDTYNLIVGCDNNFFVEGYLVHNHPGTCPDDIPCSVSGGPCNYECDSGFYNCDGDNSNGCETSTACDTTTATGTGGITVSSVLTIDTNATLNAGSKTWTLSGSGTPFVINGTFNAGTSTFQYTASGATTPTATTYNNLELKPSASVTFTLPAGTITVSGNLIIGDGVNTGTIDADTNDPTLDINGNFTISANATFIASATGTFTVAGNWSNSGTFTHSNGTVTFDGTSQQTLSGTMTGSSAFYNLTITNNSGTDPDTDPSVIFSASATSYS